MRAPLVLVLVASLLGCSTTAVPVGRNTAVDPETAPSCARVCKQVGMRVAAIVFISNMGGCVCEPEPPAPRPEGKADEAPAARSGVGRASPAAVGGAVAVMLEEVQRQEAAQERQLQQPQPEQRFALGGASHP